MKLNVIMAIFRLVDIIPLHSATTCMAEREGNLATGYAVEELLTKRGATVVWMCFAYKRSDVQQTTIRIMCKK